MTKRNNPVTILSAVFFTMAVSCGRQKATVVSGIDHDSDISNSGQNTMDQESGLSITNCTTCIMNAFPGIPGQVKGFPGRLPSGDQTDANCSLRGLGYLNSNTYYFTFPGDAAARVDVAQTPNDLPASNASIQFVLYSGPTPVAFSEQTSARRAIGTIDKNIVMDSFRFVPSVGTAYLSLRAYLDPGHGFCQTYVNGQAGNSINLAVSKAYFKTDRAGSANNPIATSSIITFTGWKLNEYMPSNQIFINFGDGRRPVPVNLQRQSNLYSKFVIETTYAKEGTYNPTAYFSTGDGQTEAALPRTSDRIYVRAQK